MRTRAATALLDFVAALLVVGLALTFFWMPAGAGAASARAHEPPALGTIILPEIGFGYSVTSEGPLDASGFPAGSPSASAAAGALSTLGASVDTYQRSWQDATGVNQLKDLLARFSSAAAARAFVDAARRALASSEIVSSGPLPSVPGAQRATYFASINQAGVGQTVTMRVGAYAAVLSFFSGASANPAPITAANAERVAKAQYEAIASAAGSGHGKPKAASGGLSAAGVGGVAFVVIVLAAAVATLLVLRRRRKRADEREPETIRS